MSQQVTREGLTIEEIENTQNVLENLEENLSSDGLENLSGIIKEAQYLVQQYDESAAWKTRYELPEPGERMYDPESNEKYGSGLVEVVDIHDDIEAAFYYIPEIRKTVAEVNPSHPGDVPVIRARYVDGSDKVYSFPATRLEQQ